VCKRVCDSSILLHLLMSVINFRVLDDKMLLFMLLIFITAKICI